MMKKDDLIYLDHVLQSLVTISRYLSNVSYSEFLLNEEKQDAVIRKLEICGEASKKISDSLKQKHLHIPWKAISGMRDKLIHDYFNVDLELVWETAKNEVPDLIFQIQKIIQSLDPQD